MWEDPDIARMTAKNVAEHVLAALAGLAGTASGQAGSTRRLPTRTARVGLLAAGGVVSGARPKDLTTAHVRDGEDRVLERPAVLGPRADLKAALEGHSCS
ncbi:MULTISPECIES: hypothetical protein [unclassified Streptomyces]|uniref:hypothetical protein n=1 Tax=unclassified Streptomyces TaxID=2593676 RepID=UPI003D91DEFB